VRCGQRPEAQMLVTDPRLRVAAILLRLEKRPAPERDGPPCRRRLPGYFPCFLATLKLLASRRSLASSRSLVGSVMVVIWVAPFLALVVCMRPFITRLAEPVNPSETRAGEVQTPGTSSFGSLIQTCVGTGSARGGPLTKRSGWAA